MGKGKEMGDQAAGGASTAASAPKRPSGQQTRRRSENGNTGVLHSMSFTGDRTVKKLKLSRALTIADTTTVANACQRMAKRRVDSALLTDADALLSGIITDKDIATRVIAQKRVPEKTIVSSVMTKNPIFVMTDTLALEALQKMVLGKFRHLPVVEKGEVVALLDITKCLYDVIARMEHATEKGNALAAAVEDVKRRCGNNLAGISILHNVTSLFSATSSYLESLRDRIFRPTLGSIITDTTKIATVSSVDTIYTATKKMSELHVSSVVITNGNKPSGIFTSRDVLMRVVAKNLDPGTIVDTVMSPNPECATSNMTIVDALHTMHDRKFLHLPVVDRDGYLVACVDMLQLMNAAAAMVGKNGASDAGDLTSTMLQMFWDIAFALEPPDTKEDTQRSQEEYEYLPPKPLASSSTTQLHIVHGSIMSIAKGFSDKALSKEMIDIRKGLMSCCTEGRRRKGKTVEYSADLIILDLPSDMIPNGFSTSIPPWNILQEGMLDAALQLISTVLDDTGLVVCIVSMTHREIFLRTLRRIALVLHRSVSLRGVAPFGITTDGVEVVSIDVYILGRANCPSLHFGANGDNLDPSLFKRDSNTWIHYFPAAHRMIDASTLMPFRGGHEKSPLFMQFLIETFCKKDGVVFDPLVGCGSSILACRASQRHCVAMEADPLMLSHITNHYKNIPSTSHVASVDSGDEEERLDDFELEDFQC